MTSVPVTDDSPAVVRQLLVARERRRQRHRQRVAEHVMAELIRDAAVVCAEPWVVLPTLGDTVVIRSGPPGPDAAAAGRVVKAALSAAADDGLRRHERMLLHLACTGVGRPLVPEVLASGWVGSHRFVVEEVLDGRPLAAVTSVADTRAALAAVGSIHEASAHARTWAPADVGRWLGGDLARIRAAVRSPGLRATVDALADALVEAFAEQELTAGVVHGDLWSGNVLVVDEPERRVSGVVDWERGSSSSLPELDLAHFVLCAHPLGFAAAVRASLGAPDATVGEWASALGVSTPNPSLGRAACTALTWAMHVGSGLTARRRYAPGRLWVRREVESVLEVLGQPIVLSSVAANGG